MKEQIELLQKISNKLSILVALMVMPEPGKGNVGKNVDLLSRLGLNNSETAKILDVTKGTVEVTKSRIKKSKDKK